MFRMGGASGSALRSGTTAKKHCGKPCRHRRLEPAAVARGLNGHDRAQRGNGDECADEHRGERGCARRALRVDAMDARYGAIPVGRSMEHPARHAIEERGRHADRYMRRATEQFDGDRAWIGSDRTGNRQGRRTGSARPNTSGTIPFVHVRRVGVTADCTATLRSSSRPCVWGSSSAGPGTTVTLATMSPLTEWTSFRSMVTVVPSVVGAAELAGVSQSGARIQRNRRDVQRDDDHHAGDYPHLHRRPLLRY